MARNRTITLDIGACKGCEACKELAPHCFGWDENMDKPILKDAEVDEDLGRELISYCPEDCIQFDDGGE